MWLNRPDQGQENVHVIISEAVTTSDPEDTRMNETKPDQESSTDVVTFSFKPKETSESSQSVLASHSFKFAPKMIHHQMQQRQL
ncbi:hypothetical protein KIN20_021699 [Parelaphostrongylus tenuis]|uniref:Uncharacterized protein n=1 Tax=Parelaphostrongylus tenuis TaxID=148309 RepID=A0AAD5QUS2_PARTN|nr:hypothetical protein KIN20_021699 [Parelaphostrongylus tenuis]